MATGDFEVSGGKSMSPFVVSRDRQPWRSASLRIFLKSFIDTISETPDGCQWLVHVRTGGTRTILVSGCDIEIPVLREAQTPAAAARQRQNHTHVICHTLSVWCSWVIRKECSMGARACPRSRRIAGRTLYLVDIENQLDDVRTATGGDAVEGPSEKIEREVQRANPGQPHELEGQEPAHPLFLCRVQEMRPVEGDPEQSEGILLPGGPEVESPRRQEELHLT